MEAPDLVAGLWRRPLYVEWRNYAINYVKRPMGAENPPRNANPLSCAEME
jgi:hypothetical protein